MQGGGGDAVVGAQGGGLAGAAHDLVHRLEAVEVAVLPRGAVGDLDDAADLRDPTDLGEAVELRDPAQVAVVGLRAGRGGDRCRARHDDLRVVAGVAGRQRGCPVGRQPAPVDALAGADLVLRVGVGQQHPGEELECLLDPLEPGDDGALQVLRVGGARPAGEEARRLQRDDQDPQVLDDLCGALRTFLALLAGFLELFGVCAEKHDGPSFAVVVGRIRRTVMGPGRW